MAESRDSGFRWLIAGLVVAAITTIGLFSFGFFDKRPDPPVPLLVENAEPESRPSKIKSPPLAEALGLAEDELVEVGGVKKKRPKRDVAFANAIATAELSSEKTGETEAGTADKSKNLDCQI